MTPCPAETTLSDLLAGLLPAEQRTQVLAHVEGCTDCQRVLAAAGGDSTSGTAPTEPAAAPLERGARLSRYVVLERIGAGAMGVVHAAYDPELDRQVALKVLRPEGRQVEELRRRLVLEAQALARLSHAHVVSVFDVGTHGDCVFLAMELVDGVTLAEWLKKQPRSWQEVLRVFTEAGRGLAAAHAAGLVHRDFKPANVLVGRDGRARVTDFGMARPLNRGQGATSGVGPASTVSPLTRTGALLGTPAYMAPELLTGRRADALSDQFSFCVALHEALYGVRPFEGSSLEEVARAALAGRVRPEAPGAKVPAWVRRAVLRGLRPRPEERHSSMERLLAALTPPPRRVRARVAALAGTACLLGAAVAYTVAHRTEARCEQETEKLAGAWGPERREQVRAAFLATGAPYAAAAWEKVAEVLDAHAAQWRTLRTEACIQSYERPESDAWQTAACLDTRLWQLAAVTDVLEKADAQTVRNARQLTLSLDGLTGCRDAPRLAARPQPPDALRPGVDAARRKLADAQAWLSAGRYAQGLTLTSALLEEIKALGYRPLEAEVLLAHGELLDRGGKPKEAEDILYKAVWAAEAGHDDETVARAWNLLLWVVGDHLARPADAERIAHHARAAVDRLGRERFPAIAADLHLRMVAVLLQQGKYTQAEAENAQGLELANRAHGPDSLHAADFFHALGRVHYRQKRLQQAAEAHLRALQLRERHLGPNHPELAVSLNSLAIDYDALGRTDEALAALHRAAALYGDTEGEEPSSLGFVLGTLGTKLRDQGRAEEAARHIGRARAIFERTLGPDSPHTAVAIAQLGRLASEADRPDEAFALFADAEKRFERALGPDSQRSTAVLFFRALALNRVGRRAEARRDLMRAKAILEKEHGPDNVNLALVAPPLSQIALDDGAPREALEVCERALALNERAQGPRSMAVASDLLCIAEAHLELGAPRKARPLIERAREFFSGSATSKVSMAWSSFLLARVLMEQQPPDRERAEALAEEARAGLEAQGQRARPSLEKVRAWQKRALSR